MLLETILEDMGCTPVGPAANIDDGLSHGHRRPHLDAALLDVNVAGRQVFPVAEALKARAASRSSSPPATAKAACPTNGAARPTIQKPFTEAAVRDALMKAMGVAQA
jgi:CheY-like chemotaxis protein